MALQKIVLGSTPNPGQTNLSRDSSHWPLVCWVVEWTVSKAILTQREEETILCVLVSLTIRHSEWAPAMVPWLLLCQQMMLTMVLQGASSTEKGDSPGGVEKVEEFHPGLHVSRSSRTLTSGFKLSFLLGECIPSSTSWLSSSTYMARVTKGQANLDFSWSH